MIDNPGLNTRIGCKTLDAHLAAGLITAAGVSTSLEDSGVTHAELSDTASEQTGLVMITGEAVVFRVNGREWWDLDNDHDILAEVLWQSGKAAATTGVIWTVKAKAVDVGEAIGDPSSTPAATIVFDAQGSSQHLLASSGIKAFRSIGILKITTPTRPKLYTNKQLLNLYVELTDDGNTVDPECMLLGLNLYYTVAMLNASQRQRT